MAQERDGTACGGAPRGLLDEIVQTLLPAHCFGCDEPLPWRVQPLNLCSDCRFRLARPDDEACRLCGATTAVGSWLCPACSHDPPAFDRLLAGWSYEPPIDDVIQAFKFHGLEYLGRHLGVALARQMRADLRHIDLVTTVPLHWRRRWERGFNQSERIAVALAKELGLPFRRLLRRHRATPPQSTLPRRDRRKNLQGAFVLRRGARVKMTLAGADVLLVDDVATTGATLSEASRVLRAAGAATVTALVAARTPNR